MADPGYVRGMESLDRSAYERAQIQETLQRLAAQKWLQQQQEEAQARALQAQRGAGATLQSVFGGGMPPTPPPSPPPVQAMAPGVGSQPQGPPPPAAAAFGPQAGMMGGAMTQPPPPVPMMTGPAAPPPAAQAAPTTPAPPGWTPGKTATPDLGGGPPRPPSIQPGQAFSVQTAIKAMTQQGVPPEQIIPQLEQMLPAINAQNKQELDEYKIQSQLNRDTIAFQRERLAELNAQIRSEQGEKRLSQEEQRLAQGERRIDIMERKTLAGRAGSAPTGGGAGFMQEFSKMPPEDQKSTIYYAMQSLSGDYSWRVGLSRGKGGSEMIRRVEQYVPILAEELGLSPMDAVGNRAKMGANFKALTTLQQNLVSIRPFKEMVDLNGQVLKDLADKTIQTNVAFANRTLNWLRTNASDNPTVATFLAQVRIFQTEAARVLNNPRLVGELTDTARKDMEQVIHGDMPLNALKAVVDRLGKDADFRVDKMESEKSRLLGEIKTKPGSTSPTKAGGPSKEEWLKAAKTANPTSSDAELSDYYDKKYGNR